MDILAEMPKFPERESSLVKKAQDTEADTAELSAIKLRAQQQASNALVVTGQQPANEPPPVSQLTMVKIPTTNHGQELTEVNGVNGEVDGDTVGDLLAIEGPPGIKNENDALDLAPIEEHENVVVKPIGDIAERFHALCLKDSGVLYEESYVQIGIKAEWRAHQGRVVLFLGNKTTSSLESVKAVILPPSHLKLELSSVPEIIPPRAQVQCPLEVLNIRPSRDVAVLDFSYKFGTTFVNNKLRLPAVMNKFFNPISISAEDFFPQWRTLSPLAAPPLKLQEVVSGVRPMSLGEMANLLNSWRLIVCPGLDPNASNLVATTTFYSETTRAMLCLVRIETDPADRTQLRMTVASGDILCYK